MRHFHYLSPSRIKIIEPAFDHTHLGYGHEIKIAGKTIETETGQHTYYTFILNGEEYPLWPFRFFDQQSSDIVLQSLRNLGYSPIMHKGLPLGFGSRQIIKRLLIDYDRILCKNKGVSTDSIHNMQCISLEDNGAVLTRPSDGFIMRISIMKAEKDGRQYFTFENVVKADMGKDGADFALPFRFFEMEGGMDTWLKLSGFEPYMVMDGDKCIGLTETAQFARLYRKLDEAVTFRHNAKMEREEIIGKEETQKTEETQDRQHRLAGHVQLEFE